jgi:hypothetical protein
MELLAQLTHNQEHGNTTKEDCPNIELLENPGHYPTLLGALLYTLTCSSLAKVFAKLDHGLLLLTTFLSTSL